MQRSSALKTEDARKYVGLRLKKLKGRVGEYTIDYTSARQVVNPSSVSIRTVKRRFLEMLSQGNQHFRMRDGERTEQNCVHVTENCGICPDSECKRHDSQRCEDSVGHHSPHSVPNVLKQLFKPYPRPRRSNIFF